jgi:2,5-diketo-D-gluconate reductase A
MLTGAEAASHDVRWAEVLRCESLHVRPIPRGTYRDVSERAFRAAKGFRAIAYSSLVPLASWRDVEGQESATTAEMNAAGTRADSPFRAMARKYGVSEAQVLLRWAVQRGFGVIPGAPRKKG